MPMEAVLERCGLETVSPENILRAFRLIVTIILLICICLSVGTIHFDKNTSASGMNGKMMAPGTSMADELGKTASNDYRELKNTSTDLPVVTSVDDRGETLMTTTSVGELLDIPAIISADVSAVVPVETSTGVPAIKTVDNQAEVPTITPADNQADIPRVTPADNQADVPAITPVDDPVDVPTDVPAENPADDAKTETPADAEEPAENPTVEAQNVRGFLVNEAGCITGYQDLLVAKSGILALPEDTFCTSVGSHAFAGLENDCMEIYIPANITWIEPDAFAELSNVFYIEVAPDNPVYYSDFGVLYSMDGELVCYPGGR